MENNSEEAVWLSLSAAVEMVEPYKLEEVLETLQANQIIDDFTIGTTLVRIVKPRGKRFDLAMYFAETTLKPPGVRDTAGAPDREGVPQSNPGQAVKKR